MPRLEHIGLAVDEVASALDCFEALLTERPYKSETIADQGVRTHFLDADSAKLELLEATSGDSPVGRFLERRGEGIHHLAFEVDNLSQTMDRLRAAGFTLLNDTPQPGADDKQICFVHPKETHGVLVEFCETPPVASWSPTNVAHRDGTLAVYERGDRTRPTVLCLHGAAGCVTHDLAPLMRRLEPRLHVVGVDLSGHGASALPSDDTLTIDRMAADARRALDALEVPQAHVFGFSMGGAVGLQLASSHPNRIRRIGVLSTNATWTDALASTLQRQLHLEHLRDRAPERAARLTARHEAPERLLPALRAFIGHLPAATDRMVSTLEEIEAPTLVAGLDRDPLFDLEATRALHRHLPDARLAVLPGDTHSLPNAPLDVLVPLLQRHYGTS
jgi:methylmalonyl-CoA epimerase